MDGELLAHQLGQLGKQLDEATGEVARLDILVTGQSITVADLKEEYEDALATEFLALEGTVELRKQEARLNCRSWRKELQEASARLERVKAELRAAQAMVRMLERRIDIGRSLLSREKALAAML